MRWTNALTLACVCTLGSAGAETSRSRAQVAPTLVVIAHPSCGVESLSATELEAIFTLSKRRWDNGKHIVAFNYDTRNAYRRAFDRAVLGLDPDEVGQFWIDQRIRGGARPPRHVNDARLMSRVIGRLSGSIGYVPEGSIPAGVRVLARIQRGRVLPP